MGESGIGTTSFRDLAWMVRGSHRLAQPLCELCAWCELSSRSRSRCRRAPPIAGASSPSAPCDAWARLCKSRRRTASLPTQKRATSSMMSHQLPTTHDKHQGCCMARARRVQSAVGGHSSRTPPNTVRMNWAPLHADFCLNGTFDVMSSYAMAVITNADRAHIQECTDRDVSQAASSDPSSRGKEYRKQ